MSSSPAEIKRRLEQNWIQFLAANSAKLSMDRLDGATPPSVFVGRYGYPKVRVGPMIPPMHGDTSILDRTEMWVGKSLEEIAAYRLSLVRGVANVSVGDVTGRYIEGLQELAMSERPAESEATFEKRPLADTDLERELRLNTEAAPFGPAAPIKTFKPSSSLSADQRIEKAFYDSDLKASDAVMELYNRGVDASSIHRVLSVGMLGVKKNRRLVPTRWSITATDDMISGRLVKQNAQYPAIDLYEVRQYSHLGNYYSVVLVPESAWNFEMIESWYAGDGRMAVGADYEDARGLDHYPTIAGAYFAARLAVAEHLSRRRRSASALVLREIHPEYVMPVGVWQIREGVREAMKKRPARTFDSLDSAITFACSTMSQSKAEIVKHSRLYRTLRTQTRITDF
ncbi:hypothetical protein [Nitrososphaera sp.]|uniref:hypothetical protein n=1 Tax=Nitrososphaera sp. TaxID=1971748 RepID=UPI00307E380F